MDSCAKEFKVVIFYIGAHEKGGCFFSSRNQYWLEIPEDEMADYDGDYVTAWQSPQVMIDGVAHWGAANKHEYYGGLIVTYDFEQGKFGKMSLPEIVSCWGLIIYVSKWDDSLSIVVSEGYPVDSPEFELWVLKNGSWSKMMMFFPTIGVGRVFCVLDRFTALVATEEELLILYDAEDGSFTHLRSRKAGCVPLNWHCGDAYSLSFGYDFVEFCFP